MPSARTKRELRTMVRDALKKAMQNEIAPKVEEELRQHIKDDVYGAYKPKKYKRRKNAGGMLQRDNVQTTFQNGGYKIIVQDKTVGNTPYVKTAETPPEGVFSRIINDGLQGNNGGLWKDAFARPYIDNTQDAAAEIVEIVLDGIGIKKK